MIEPLAGSDSYQIAAKLLDAVSLRQEALAANIANAETPGYKRVDVAPAFFDELRASIARGDFKSAGVDLQATLAEDEHARTVRPDGNSVEIEHELAEMNRNSIEHEFLTEIVSTNLRQLRMAISGKSA